MTIYPAIDIKGGRCVRLTQGRADKETVYAEDPVEVAALYREAGAGWVHVVDLDGAFTGEPMSLPIVQKIAALGVRVQLGGGLRTRASVERALDFGVSRVVIGTRAADSEDFVAELIQAYGEKVAVGIDAKNGQVAVKGWVSSTGLSAVDLALRMDALGVRTLIHTDIGTDGMLTGPNYSAQKAMLTAVNCRVIASGGVGCRDDVITLAKLAQRDVRLDGVIIGKALYEARVDLQDMLEIAKGAGSA